MAHRNAFLFAVAALIAAIAFAVHVLIPSEAPEDDPLPAARTPEIADLVRRMDRLEQEVFQPRLEPLDPAALLASLEERVRRLEEEPDPSGSTGVEAEPAPRPQTDDPRTLSDEQLMVRARRLAENKESQSAVTYWQELIDRRPPTEVLLEAYRGLGLAYRGQGEHEKEEEAFREIIRLAGPDSTKAQEAAYQLAWSQRFREDFASARETMEGVARSPATSRNLTGHARLNIAQLSLKMDDAVRAREVLESMVAEFSDSVDPMHSWFVDRARAMLKGLDAR
ncbi:MAG: tetratricopeptide repeat protein [Planctomycetota bacterium]|jgi:tetratricopeptide (TPR) repeat protein